MTSQWMQFAGSLDGRRWRHMALIFCALPTLTLVSACGRSTPDIRDVDDPAMQVSTPVAAQIPIVEAPVAIEVVPTTIQYNDTGDQIFVPGTGWFDAGEFWDMYFNEPAKLPAELDFGALAALREQRQVGELAISDDQRQP